MNRPTLILLCAAATVPVGALAFALGSARRPAGTPPPVRFAAHRPATLAAEPPPPDAAAPGPARSRAARSAVRPARPLATVAGSEPNTHLTLLGLRRTGPKVVTATLRLTLDRRAREIWTPRLEGPGGDRGTASGLRLVDEVNARDHSPLRDADDRCLCSSGIDTLETAGETVVVSAKFPAPPPDVAYASLQAPGFPSLDRIPLGS